jgi:hypothetical protein
MIAKKTMRHVSTWRKGKRLSSDDGCPLTFHWMRNLKFINQHLLKLDLTFEGDL